MREITNEQLMLSDIPDPEANWNTLGEFALTFDGYNILGSFKACAEIANSQRHDSLSDLRMCLFFEQRRWRHFDEEPDEKAMAYIRQVVEKIRALVAAKDLR